MQKMGTFNLLADKLGNRGSVVNSTDSQLFFLPVLASCEDIGISRTLQYDRYNQ